MLISPPNTKSFLLECAAKWNNKGALAFIHGRFAHAKGFFEAAIDVLEQYESFGPPLVPALPYAPRPAEMIDYWPCTALTPTPALDLIHESFEWLGLFVLLKPFAFTPGVPLSFAHLKAHKAVMMFNLALVHHCLWLLNYCPCPFNHPYMYSICSASSGHDDQALRYYESSLRLMGDAKDASEGFINVVIAFLNNKAQIHYFRYEFDTSRPILDQTGTLLSSVSCENPSFDDDDIDGIVSNVLCQYTVAGASVA